MLKFREDVLDKVISFLLEVNEGRTDEGATWFEIGVHLLGSLPKVQNKVIVLSKNMIFGRPGGLQH